MRLESTKLKDQEYFAAWDKKIENTSTCIVVNLATLIIMVVLLNIFLIAIWANWEYLTLTFKPTDYQFLEPVSENPLTFNVNILWSLEFGDYRASCVHENW